ncbi:hypothetical protein MRB53_040412 [Persea americana]|nr:hypothetical protein MRB53_040412 [Persea americana]
MAYGLRGEHFVEYVKPVLVAAALEWDVIEGRREGEVRAGLAERIRKLRRKAGEHAEAELEWGPAQALEALRERTGVQESREVKGDIVIGRHTWKEYVRGVHEGWLGPMDAPKQEQQDVPPSSKPNDDAAAVSDSELSTLAAVPSVADDADGASPTAATPEQKPEETQNTNPPNSIPTELQPATAIPFPHILGFLNTPIRMYRFLNRRQVADETGRQAAAAVFALYRPYNHITSSELSDSSSAEAGTAWEQESVLAHEERDWHKDTKKRADTDGEREWLDDVVLDPRIAERMRRFQLEPIQEERAKRIAAGNPGLPARHASSEGEGAS